MNPPPGADEVADVGWPEVPTGDRVEPYAGTLNHFLAGILAHGPVKLAEQAVLLIETGRPAMAARILTDMGRVARIAMCVSHEEGRWAGKAERNTDKNGT